ncbi:MAG: Transposase [Cenarchaeum symbiont of Oopsacas minuta]|nr:Transposase [Cenarchaeum symbiont of Oopsacas minuta]
MDNLSKQLKDAHRKEREPNIRDRIVAVQMVHVNNMNIGEVAAGLFRTPEWVNQWIERFDEKGIDGLRDLPRSGRPPLIKAHKLDKIISDAIDNTSITPKIMKKVIFKKAKINFHITYVRKLLHKYGMTPKTPQRVHINAANDSMCYNWQNNLKRDLSGTKFEDFTVIEEDESIFVYDSITGKKYWTVDIPPVVKWTGMHSKVIVYGAVTEDGRQLFKTYHRFDSESTVDYLKLLEKKFGKIFVILDRAPQHRSRMVKEYLRDHKDTVISSTCNSTHECCRRMLASG